MERKPLERKPRAISSRFHPTAQPAGVYRHRYNPSEGIKYEDLFDESFWDAVSDKVRVVQDHNQGQIIEVFPDDGSYFAELIAVKLSNGQVRVEELFYKGLGKSAQAVDDNRDLKRNKFEVKLRGPRKWSVLEKGTGKVLFEDLATQDEAIQQMNAHIEELVA